MPRRPRGGLAAWLTESTTPLFVIDSRRVVLYFNHGCEQLTGWSAGDVVGRTCVYAVEPDGTCSEALTGALCPPPQALAGELVTVDAVIPCKHGTTVRRRAVYVPLPVEGAEVPHVLGVLSPHELVGVPHDPQSADPHAALGALRDELRRRHRLDTLIAHSAEMRKVAVQVQLAASSHVSVHLSGRSGSGRGFLARLIHTATSAATRPLVPLDCSRLSTFELHRTLLRLLEPDQTQDPPDLSQRPAAVLLQEVTHLPRDLQRWLLDHPTALAGNELRWYTTCSEPLAAAVEDERLIPELFHHWTALTIEVPALRQRRDDLPLLCQFFLEERNRAGDRQVGGAAPETLQRLQQYNWPGEVRELQQVLDEAHAAAAGALIQPDDLPFRFRTGWDAQRIVPSQTGPQPTLDQYLRTIEVQEIRRVLTECGDNRAQAARRLGMTRPRLYRRMEQLGIIDASGDSLTAAVDDSQSATNE